MGTSSVSQVQLKLSENELRLKCSTYIVFTFFAAKCGCEKKVKTLQISLIFNSWPRTSSRSLILPGNHTLSSWLVLSSLSTDYFTLCSLSEISQPPSLMVTLFHVWVRKMKHSQENVHKPSSWHVHTHIHDFFLITSLIVLSDLHTWFPDSEVQKPVFS